MPVKAVIFDMDGVLLDSMRYHVRAWQETFLPLGAKISDYEVYKREGENWKKSTRDFIKMAGFTPTEFLVQEIFKARGRIFKEIFMPRIFRGARQLLECLHKRGLRLALVTATPRKDVVRMLPVAMIKLFEVMICGGDTKRGKPHPEPYLTALKKLRLKAEDAIVVENAPYGIRSCKLAGLKCIAITTSLPKKYLKGADIIVNSLSQVRCLSWPN